MPSLLSLLIKSWMMVTVRTLVKSPIPKVHRIAPAVVYRGATASASSVASGAPAAALRTNSILAIPPGPKPGTFKAPKRMQVATKPSGTSGTAGTAGTAGGPWTSPIVHHPLPPEDLDETVFFFTDGSCQGNRNVAQSVNAAGWGAVAVKLNAETIINRLQDNSVLELPSLDTFLTQATCQELVSLYGPVVTPQSVGLEDFSLGATLGSNNTGELQAIGEALLHIQNHLPLPRRVVILYDSEYAAKSVIGEFNGAKNRELINRIRSILQKLVTSMRAAHGGAAGGAGGAARGGPVGLNFVHVKAHASHFYNEKADLLAKLGASGEICEEGRYAVRKGVVGGDGV